MRVLARRQLLLVLDNCELMVGAAAELCTGLQTALRTCGCIGQRQRRLLRE